MKHLDLCSGIGGFALAARWMGWETVGFAEIDPFASKVLEKHWPGVPNHGDIANVPAGIEADIITAGFPCQPYSCAGKRLGAEDDRAIWPLVIDVVRRVKPHWCVFENVVGFVEMALDGVLSDLEAEGYEVGTLVLPACAVNAPHRRDRVWIVAFSDRQLRQSGEGERPGVRDKAGIERPDVIAGRASHKSEALADADREPLGWATEPRGQRGGGIAQSRLGRVAHGLPGGMDRHFDAEPEHIPRVARGIKDRVSRLKALGNAIVPQVALEIFSAIGEAA